MRSRKLRVVVLACAFGFMARAAAAQDAATANPNLGARCVDDAQCGAGLICIELDSTEYYGGGPPGGLCTAPCTSDASVCPALSPGATCVGFGWEGYCLEGCTTGGSSLFNPRKCHGRPELACTELRSSLVACVPQCNSDADCAPLYCNPQTGACVSTPASGDPIGNHCSILGGTETCRGICIGTASSNSAENFCTELCTIGADASCGWRGPGTGPADSACLLVYSQQSGFGDLGACAQLCDCDEDCRNPAFKCIAVPNLQSFTLRQGYCYSPADADGGLRPSLPDCDAGPPSGSGGAGGSAGSAGTSGSGGTAIGGSGGAGAGMSSGRPDAGGATALDAGSSEAGVTCGPGTVLHAGQCVAAGSNSDGGCGCRAAAPSPDLPLRWLLTAASLAALLVRRKPRVVDRTPPGASV